MKCACGRGPTLISTGRCSVCEYERQTGAKVDDKGNVTGKLAPVVPLGTAKGKR